MSDLLGEGHTFKPSKWKNTIHGGVDCRRHIKQETGIPAKEICREYGILKLPYTTRSQITEERSLIM